MMNFVEIKELVKDVVRSKFHGVTLNDWELQSTTKCDTDIYTWYFESDNKRHKVNVHHNKVSKEVEISIWKGFWLIKRHTKQYI